MITLASSFLIGSSLLLQVTRTTITSWMGSNFDKIRPGTYELAALERKNPHRLIMGTYCDQSSSFIFKWIIFILAGNKTNHKSLGKYEFWQGSITDFGESCP